MLSHAEGGGTHAEGHSSHAEGFAPKATGDHSHAEGIGSDASGEASHAEGTNTTASGDYSHAEGVFTDTNSHKGAHVMGNLGRATHDYSWFLVNGGSVVAAIYGVQRFVLPGDACFNGQVHALAGFVTGSGCDFAELFETIDGQRIDVGYFVTLDGEKVKRATADSYVLGVTSASPGILATDDLERRYQTDSWGRLIMEEVTVEAITDEEGKVVVPARVESRPKQNPNYVADSCNGCSPLETYARSGRVAVGLMGRLRVRDDGTCRVNGYCRPNDRGIAAAAPRGYRVMKRLSPNQVLILFDGPAVLEDVGPNMSPDVYSPRRPKA